MLMNTSLLIRSKITVASRNAGYMLKRYMEEYVPKSINAVSVNLGARFLALQQFNDTIIEPPTFFSWMFVFMSQVVFGEVAVKYTEACGFKDMERNKIHEVVNKDLRILYKLATGIDADREKLKKAKVILLYLTITDQIAFGALFYSILGVCCTINRHVSIPIQKR